MTEDIRLRLGIENIVRHFGGPEKCEEIAGMLAVIPDAEFMDAMLRDPNLRREIRHAAALGLVFVADRYRRNLEEAGAN